MANDLTSNPLRCDTAATVIAEAGGQYVQVMQWIDDDSAAGGAIGDGEDLIFTINGVLHEINIGDASTQLAGGAEETFRQALLLSDSGVLVFVQRPVSLAFLILGIMAVFFRIRKARKPIPKPLADA